MDSNSLNMSMILHLLNKLSTFNHYYIYTHVRYVVYL